MENWKIIYDEYDPKREKVQEALCTLGNGYFATRGAAEESQAGKHHYPGTYFAGGYNRVESNIKDQKIENEDLVNWPNWLPLNFKPENGDWLDLDTMLIKKYQKELDMKHGILRREFLVEDAQKRQTSIVSERFVHMQHEHLAGIRWQLTPVNWSGKITVKTAIDGGVINNGVPRYRSLNGKHLQPKGTESFGEDGILLETATSQSAIKVAMAARTYVTQSKEFRVSRQMEQSKKYIEEQLSFDVKEKQEYGIEKIVAIYSSKDMAISQPILEARNAVTRAPSFDKLLKQQAVSWRAYWQRCDIEIDSGQQQDQRLLRLHIFHCLQTNSMNSIDLDVGVPSRGWHGEAYRGHILWDELFIFPFLNCSVPEITRSLLMYRYRRLFEARSAAKASGYEGAMYPWQSGSNGREESQEIHLNPESGNWIPDDTHLQRHVNAAIAYNIWQYYQITQDDEFLSFFGAEMLLEIARFWASKATYNAERERYEIHGVVGPDEYHVSYPNSEKPGLNNNAYTNVMVAWLLNIACQTVDLLDDTRKNELLEKLEIDCDEFDIWRNISKKIFVPFTQDGLISQYEGFENLQELDWEHYHQEYGDILRLDRILEKEGDSPDNYKASKQADVLMLFYLFSHEELTEIFQRLGKRVSLGERKLTG